MYAYFIGVADCLVKNNGIVTLITSNTYLSIPTYKWLRKYLLLNYKIHYIINFNKISDRGSSIFAPEAAIGTCIIVMTKGYSDDNKIRYLDLSEKPSIVDKYKAICKVNRLNKQYNDKNAIEAFSEINLKSIPFIELQQDTFLRRKEYIINYSTNEILLDKIEQQSIDISQYGNLNAGVGPGDVKYLVNKTIEGLKYSIENYVFEGDLTKLNKHQGNIFMKICKKEDK
jgi:hypothetical protein